MIKIIEVKKIYGSRGKKIKKRGEKGKKIRQKEEETHQTNFPPCGCKIDFSGRWGGGNNMLHLHNIYACTVPKKEGGEPGEGSVRGGVCPRTVIVRPDYSPSSRLKKKSGIIFLSVYKARIAGVVYHAKYSITMEKMAAVWGGD